MCIASPNSAVGSISLIVFFNSLPVLNSIKLCAGHNMDRNDGYHRYDDPNCSKSFYEEIYSSCGKKFCYTSQIKIVRPRLQIRNCFMCWDSSGN